VQEHVQDQPGVVQAEANPTTGTLVVHYDRHDSPGEAVVGALGDVGVILRDLAENLGGEELPSAGPGPTERFSRRRNGPRPTSICSSTRSMPCSSIAFCAVGRR
jgi:hypothetical protein